MSDLDDQLDRSETAILEAAYAIDRLSEPIPDDPTDVRLGAICPLCGRMLEVDVNAHPNETGVLLGVVMGIRSCGCQP